ncbi:MAG: hypothetical protein R3A12_16485 [Ignavibacteria bacterium]
MSALAIIASSIEKFTSEIRHLQKTETLNWKNISLQVRKVLQLWPHKKNPITCERLSEGSYHCGNTLAAYENIPLWHERDISHSSVERVILPDSTILIDYMLYQFARLIDNLVVSENNIKQNLELTHGLVFSQTVLLKLTRKEK